MSAKISTGREAPGPSKKKALPRKRTTLPRSSKQRGGPVKLLKNLPAKGRSIKSKTPGVFERLRGSWPASEKLVWNRPRGGDVERKVGEEESQ